MKKFLLIFSIALSIILIAFLIALPSLLEYAIEEYDKEQIGREIEIENIDLNYFTLELIIEGLDFHETDDVTSFVHFDSMYVDVELWPMLSSHFHIREFGLTNWGVNIVQHNSSFNFDDLMALGANDSTAIEIEEVDEEPSNWHFTVENVKLDGGMVDYESNLLPHISLNKIEYLLPKASDTMNYIVSDLAFALSTGGDFHIKNGINLVTSDVNVNLQSSNVNLELIHPYLDPYIHYSSMDGVFNSDVNFTANMENPDLFDLGGNMSINDFGLNSLEGDQVVAFKTFEIDIDTIQLNDAVYELNAITLDELNSKFELYETDNNFTRLLKPDTTSTPSSVETMTADGEEEIDYANPFALLFLYVKDMLKSYQESSYKLKKLEVKNSSCEMIDYTTKAEDFKYRLDDINVHADGLTSTEESVTFYFGAILNHSGKFDGYIRPYTANPADLDIHYEIKGTEMNPFTAYTMDYVNYPIEFGRLLYTCDVQIKDRKVVSSNIIEFDQFNWGKKNKKTKALYNLPVKLATGLLKDMDGNILLDVPVEGDLDDPKFKFGRVIWRTLKNLVLKVVSAPFKLLGKLFGFNGDDIKEIRFGHLSRKLNKKQEKQLQNLAKVMKKKEELNVEFLRTTKKYDEVEKYALLEMKYRYLYKTDTVPNADQVTQELLDQLEDLSNHDSSFVSYVNTLTNNTDTLKSTANLSVEYVGEEKALSRIDKIGTMRYSAIRRYLIDEQQIDSNRIRLNLTHPDSLLSHKRQNIYKVAFWTD